MLDAVILAGGKSSRMGQDKALMPFGGYESMARYQYERLKPLFNNVYLSAKENKFNFNAPIIYDKYEEYSPLIAIKSIIEELNKPFFLIAVDMPLIPLDEIKKLIYAYKKNPNYNAYIFKSPKGLEPTIAIYSNNCLKNIDKILKKNEHKMKIFLSEINFYSVKCNYDKYFINLNTLKEYYSVKKG